MFQGFNENLDITTLGRGGSDTTAIAIAATLEAKNCYIFSDVEGVYSADPNIIKVAKKIPALSYKEMLAMANEGARVLNNRSIEIGEKFGIPIISKSTFNNESGSVISNVIEEENNTALGNQSSKPSLGTNATKPTETKPGKK